MCEKTITRRERQGTECRVQGAGYRVQGTGYGAPAAGPGTGLLTLEDFDVEGEVLLRILADGDEEVAGVGHDLVGVIEELAIF